MDLTLATPLLGGLSPRAFMRAHWQQKPLLVRRACPMPCAPLGRDELFALAAQSDVESRLVVREGRRWSVRHGPIARRALPALRQPAWTLLVQGVDLHVEAAHELLARFRFVADARLDDLMVSYASDAGGVGPHFDSYDVFLLQVQGRRRWRIAPLADETLRAGVPLKMLRRFEAAHDWLLEPGDMLYLPPRWAHEGIAEGECMTCSIGFRAPARAELAHEVLQRALEAGDTPPRDALYADARQAATAQPGRIPTPLQRFARAGVTGLLRTPALLERALGELMTEPKPRVHFDRGSPLRGAIEVRLDRRSRMMYDARHVYLNGESYRAAGRDARLMQRLADRRRLDGTELAGLSAQALALVDGWARAGWLRAIRSNGD